MSPQEWQQKGHSRFEVYLRTGVILPVSEAPLALKYNPWHDIEDGRFTRAGMGKKVPPKFGGFGGGGGSFGGAGASGSWDAPSPAKPKPKPKSPPAEQGEHPVIVARPQSPSPREQPLKTSSTSPIVETFRSNGYAFGVDAQFRTRQITGTLANGPSSERSRWMQSQAGKPERLPSDDGGHYIAIRFNGPREKFNHFAQDSNVNRGRYRALEDQWARNLARGRMVVVNIKPRFNGGAIRPYEIDIIWHINGRRSSLKMPNVKGK